MKGIDLILLIFGLSVILFKRVEPAPWSATPPEAPEVPAYTPDVTSDDAVRFFISNDPEMAQPEANSDETISTIVDDMDAKAIESIITSLNHFHLPTDETGRTRFQLSSFDESGSEENTGAHDLGSIAMTDDSDIVVPAAFEESDGLADPGEETAPIGEVNVDEPSENAETEIPTTTLRTTEMTPEVDVAKVELALSRWSAVLAECDRLNDFDRLEFATVFVLVLLIFCCAGYICYLKRFRNRVTQLVVDEVKSYDGQTIVLLVPASAKPVEDEKIVTMPAYVKVKTLERY